MTQIKLQIDESKQSSHPESAKIGRFLQMVNDQPQLEATLKLIGGFPDAILEAGFVRLDDGGHRVVGIRSGDNLVGYVLSSRTRAYDGDPHNLFVEAKPDDNYNQGPQVTIE